MRARQQSASRAPGAFLGCMIAGLILAPGTWGMDPCLGLPPPPCFVPTLEPSLLASPYTPVVPTPPSLDAGDPPAPAVVIRVRVPASVAVGKEIEYRIRVENHGLAAAHHVIVRNPIPAHARFVRASPEPSAREPELVWELGTLPGRTYRDLVLVLAPSGSDDVKNCARVQFEHGECVTTRIARPALSLRKTGPAQAILYDQVHYTLTVTNTGSVEATGIVLTDQLPDGLDHASGKRNLIWNLESIAPGQSRSVEYQVIAKLAGRHCNRAVASAPGGVRAEHEACVTVAEPKLSLSINGSAEGYINLPRSYQITVANMGSVPIGNVRIADELPAQLTFVSASEGGRLVGSQVQWLLGTLAPAARRTVDVVLRAQVPGRLCQRVTISADRGLTEQKEFCTDFAAASALLLEVADSRDPVEVGGTTNYLITVSNQGMVPATNVRIVATVPEQMTIANARGPANYRKEGQQVIYEPAMIPAGGAVRYQVEVTAAKAGDVRFRVELTADQLPAGPVRRQESTTIFSNVPSVRLKRAS